MTEQLNTQDLVQSLKQFVSDYVNDDSKIIIELTPAIKEAAKKGISRKQVFEHLKSKGFKMSYSSFTKWLDKLNLYSYKPRTAKKAKKDYDHPAT